MAYVPDLEALRLVERTDTETPLARDQRTSIYAHRLRSNAFPNNFAVLDPDRALDQDPDFYDKVMNELGILSPLRKRVSRTAAAGWTIQAEIDSPEVTAAAETLKWAYGFLKSFDRDRRNLLFQAIMKGWGIARMAGKYVQRTSPNDSIERKWWVPTTLSDIGKERMRINENPELDVLEGAARYYWTIQDVITQRWYPLDFEGAQPGLRRGDYIWVRTGDAEDDLGYSHGLGRVVAMRWYWLTHLWLYGLDGAESWAKGKLILKTPNAFGGQGMPGDLNGIRSSQAIRDELARTAAAQLSRHALVIDSTQDYQVVGQPTSGHEAVKWGVMEIKDELKELITGIDPKLRDKSMNDIDPALVAEDMSNLESGFEELKWAFVKWNAHNLTNSGIPLCSFDHVKLQFKREPNMSPEQLGKSMMIAAALGAPVHDKDIYGGLGLTFVRRDSPHAVLLPPPGSPVSAMGSSINPQPMKGAMPGIPDIGRPEGASSGGVGTSSKFQESMHQLLQFAAELVRNAA
jgi:hypothetical protein